MIGVDARAFGEHEPQAAADNTRAVFAMHAAGKIRPRIAHEFSVRRFDDAMNAARNPRTLGRVVLRFD